MHVSYVFLYNIVEHGTMGLSETYHMFFWKKSFTFWISKHEGLNILYLGMNFEKSGSWCL